MIYATGKAGNGISTTDFALEEQVANWEASWEINSRAYFPQALYNSTTYGTQTHPSSLHLPSLEQCFLCSVIHEATPVVTLASKRIVGLSGVATNRSIAAGLLKTQFGTLITIYVHTNQTCS